MLYWKGVRQMFKLGEIKMYSPADVCEALHIGRVKCLELFHRADFPAQKYGRGFGIEANALTNYMSSRHILS